MDSLASKVGWTENKHNIYTNNPHLKLKTYGFAIAIIVGIGGFALWGAGIHLAAFSHLNQLHAIIVMALGGMSGTTFLIMGMVGLVKNCSPKSTYESSYIDDISFPKPQNTEPPFSGKSEKPEISAANIPEELGLVYGADAQAWKEWQMEILDNVPQVPQIQWNENDPFFRAPFRDNYVLIYVPTRIRFKGKEQDLNLEIYKGFDGLLDFIHKCVEDQVGTGTAGGWVLMSKTVIPGSRSKNYADQKKMVETEKGFFLPSALEAVVLNLVVHVATSTPLYGRDPSTYTRCLEQIDGKYPVCVGGFGPSGLYVGYEGGFDGFEYSGVACALREVFHATRV